MTTYVQRKGQGYLETVDEFSTRREALSMLAEYRLSDPSARYYLSSRPCRDWGKDWDRGISVSDFARGEL